MTAKINYTKTAQKHIAAFGIYAAIMDQSCESGFRVIQQIEGFILDTIAKNPTIGVQTKKQPHTRRIPDDFGRSILFRYFPQKNEVDILGVYKGNLQKLDYMK